LTHWKSDVQRYIESRWSIGSGFSLAEIYTDVERFTALHPKNKHVHEKIRQVMQELRKDGLVDFVDNKGTYIRRS
jgi:hypothetical protein